MKECIILTLVFISMLSSCHSRNNDLKLTDYSVKHTIRLEENDTSFISGLKNIEFFENNNFLLNSSGNGIVLIYDHQTGKLLNTIKFPILLMDSLKYHYEKFELFDFENNKVYSYNELVNLVLSNSKDRSKESIIENINELYKRRIVYTKITDSKTLVHLIDIGFLFYNSKYNQNIKQQFAMFVNTENNNISKCFVPNRIFDNNNDPYFPTYYSFELSDDDNNLFLNTFNEFFHLRQEDDVNDKTSFTTTIQNYDYSIMELKNPLPYPYTKYGLNYNYSYPQYININNSIYCTYQFIDSIYDVHSNQSYHLKLIESNNHFFENYINDDKDLTNFKRVAFITDALSKTKSNNFIVCTKIFENYEIDSAKATKLLLQEYDGNNFNLIRSVYIPFIYKTDNKKIFNIKLIEANPHKINSFVVIYSDNENYYIDFCEW